MPTKSFFKFLILFLVLSIGPGSIYFLYSRTGGLESRREIIFHKKLRFAFMTREDSIQLISLTDWSWKKVCAFGYGISESRLETLIGFPYENYTQLSWRNLPNFLTLLFIDNQRQTNWGLHRPVIAIRIPQDSIARYAGPEMGNCAPAEKAFLFVERNLISLEITPVRARLSGG